MNRSEFIQLGISSFLYSGLSTPPLFSYPRFGYETDIYGGWTGKSFRATGYFRTEKEDRWWLVTPLGNAFLSFGFNHFHSVWWKAEYNRKAWMTLLNIDQMEAFNPAIRSWILKTCDHYGFNTIGVHNDLKILNSPNPQLPYMQPIQFVDISHWKPGIEDENFLDIFSQEFYHHCDQLAKKIASPLRNDPFLLGYSMADCPLFTEEDCRERPDNIYGGRRGARIGWPRRLRNLGPSAAGKKAYVSLMSKLYEGDIRTFNHTYDTAFDSFAAVEKTEQWRLDTDLSNANETRDNVEFLTSCVEQYYKTAQEAIGRYDPNHLFIGDKLNGNTDTVDTVLPVTAKYTDVVMYQMYGRYETQQPSLNQWSNKVDTPLINGDSAFSYVRDLMPRPYGPLADTESQSAEWLVEFFNQAFARPEFVGWHYCGLIDTPVKLIKKESNRQHSGLFDGYGNPYEQLREAVSSCSKKLYEVATSRNH
ncbi:MAG: hypothetical protein AAF587_43025 [Bacteroidota bacterium]